MHTTPACTYSWLVVLLGMHHVNQMVCLLCCIRAPLFEPRELVAMNDSPSFSNYLLTLSLVLVFLLRLPQSKLRRKQVDHLSFGHYLTVTHQKQ